MDVNQIQLQHGMSGPDVLHSFGTKAQCAEAVKQARWLDGFRCPRCDGVDHSARKLFQCNGCLRSGAC